MTDFAVKTDYRKFNKTSLGIEDTPPWVFRIAPFCTFP